MFNLFRSKGSKNKYKIRCAVLSVEDVEEIRKSGHAWNAFKELLAAYRVERDDCLEANILKFIQTETPLDDVLRSVEHEFDSAYYLTHNEDVAAATDDAVTHYLLHGWREDRSPSLFFDHRAYRKIHRFSRKVFPLAHYHQIGKATGIPANGISNQLWYEPKAPPDWAWLSVEKARRQDKTRAVVIMPVYKGYDETLAAIYHALKSRKTSPYSLLVINDNSPDKDLQAKLFELSELGLFDYHVNAVNHGFVQTINIGLQQLSGDLDVILLNSDAFVYDGWFDRLIAHAEKDSRVATITPLSNNATICSYPRFNQDNHLALELSPEALDELAARVNAGMTVEAPTGVGFCMYVRRSVVQQIGCLDAEAFKVGYGEENDFCMRAIVAGYKNIIAGDVFVFHKGSVSFASIKKENFELGQKMLAAKHPNYESAVRNHIAADPELPARRKLDAARLVNNMKGAVVFVTHNWGGGIDTYLSNQREHLQKQGTRSVILRVHDRCYVTFETWPGEAPFIPNLGGINIVVEAGFVRKILQALKPQALHINSFAGLDWHSHQQMLDMVEASDIPYDYIGHDYAPISHNYHLLRPDNVWDGIPNLSKRKQWATLQDPSGSQDICEPEQRLLRYRQFLEKARRVIVPSEAARQIFALEFPGLPIAVTPHDDDFSKGISILPAAGRQKRVIAIIGAIGPHKGSDVLYALAKHAQSNNLPIEYHLIGYSNQDDRLNGLGVRITGRYDDDDDVFQHLSTISPDFILIPSIWPETYCYALSFSFKTRIPALVFDLGAQAERVRETGLGMIMPIVLAQRPIETTNYMLSINLGNDRGNMS